uniref:Uncharacterized protein n=1 Tax=Arundo donax TaxID=35708 RepID=A0A0A9ADD1_ARUDO
MSWHEQGCSVWQRRRTRLGYLSSCLSMAARRLIPPPLRPAMRSA